MLHHIQPGHCAQMAELSYRVAYEDGWIVLKLSKFRVIHMRAT